MPGTGHGGAHSLRQFTDADAAVAHLTHIYETGANMVRGRFKQFVAGDRTPGKVQAYHPYIGIEVNHADLLHDSRPSFGTLPGAGHFGATVTRPDIFAGYYREQIKLIIDFHKVPVFVGVSARPIALPFVIENATADVSSDDVQSMQAIFELPDLARISDDVPNGTFNPEPGHPFPLALFTAERVDLGLHRLEHYTGTDASHFQRFVLFTNYQRYVEEFIEHGKHEIANGDEYDAFVEPGDVVTPNPRRNGHQASGTTPRHLPQMPAYHLVRGDGNGITLVNIGIGPSNAKTLTDHLAVLRPHCWLMIGHCGGLRRSQMLGDYVLAHAYIREDHVLDQDLPPWVPIPALAEIQVALQNAAAQVLGEHGPDLKARMRTGTVATTDNRNWELRHAELFRRFSQSRAVAIDMESATIAANGFRLRIPYGTLLCVSDKPMHGEIKLRGMANAFYRERINQHLKIALQAVRTLQNDIGALHSRKLRSLNEPPFR